ncbi:hypothetical protein ACJJJB_06860 [Microbulbifer sp. ANSA001]|uniref:hypothetical protein n=1 Tax=Microbulbifer sp. ANSA001 TaxID=3243358 RepID=UPI0040416B50
MHRSLHEKMVSILTKSEVKEDASLWEYPLFTYTLYIGIIVTLTSIVTISILLEIQTTGEGARYEACISMNCINNFFIYFSPAIKICTGFLAVLGVIALVFRSEQTATQISNANKTHNYELSRNRELWEHEQAKTAFSQFFQHKETFFSLINFYEEKFQITFHNKPTMYKDWFSGSTVTTFDTRLYDYSGGPISASTHLISFAKEASKCSITYAFSEIQLAHQRYTLIKALNDLRIPQNSHISKSIQDDTFTLGSFEKLLEITQGILEISSNDITMHSFLSTMAEIYERSGSLFRQINRRQKTPNDRVLICIFGEWYEALDGPAIGYTYSNQEIDYHLRFFSCPKTEKYLYPSFETREEIAEGSLDECVEINIIDEDEWEQATQ